MCTLRCKECSRRTQGYDPTTLDVVLRFEIESPKSGKPNENVGETFQQGGVFPTLVLDDSLCDVASVRGSLFSIDFSAFKLSVWSAAVCHRAWTCSVIGTPKSREY